MKKIKRIVALVIAVACLFGAATAVTAAPSPQADSTPAITATTEDGTPVTVSYEFDNEEDKAAATELASNPDKAAEILAAIIGEDMAAGMSVKDVVNVVVPDGTTFPVTITFQVSGVTASSKIVVLHYVNGAWKQEQAKVTGDGSISVTFDELSPVAFYVGEDAAAATNTESTITDTQVAPKTGDKSTIAFSVVILAIGICLLFMASGERKRRA